MIGNFILSSDRKTVGNRRTDAEVRFPRAKYVVTVVGRQFLVAVIIRLPVLFHTIRGKNLIGSHTFQRIERGSSHTESQTQRTFEHGAHDKAEFSVDARAGHIFCCVELISKLPTRIVHRPQSVALRVARIFFILHAAVIVHIVQSKVHAEIELLAEIESNVEIVGLITPPLHLSVVVSRGISRKVTDKLRGVSRELLLDQECICRSVNERNGVLTILNIEKIQRCVSFRGARQLCEFQCLRHQAPNTDIVERCQFCKILRLPVVEAKTHEAHASTLQR